MVNKRQYKKTAKRKGKIIGRFWSSNPEKAVRTIRKMTQAQQRAFWKKHPI